MTGVEATAFCFRILVDPLPVPEFTVTAVELLSSWTPFLLRLGIGTVTYICTYIRTNTTYSNTIHKRSITSTVNPQGGGGGGGGYTRGCHKNHLRLVQFNIAQYILKLCQNMEGGGGVGCQLNLHQGEILPPSSNSLTQGDI